MIVELSTFDLLKLTNDEQVSVGDVIVRSSNGDSKILGPVPGEPAMVEEKARSVRQRRTDARNKVVGEPQRWMAARFFSYCDEPSCKNKIQKGDWMLRDSVAEKNYCEPHGKKLFPNLKHPALTA